MPAHPWGACPAGDAFTLNPETPQAVGLAAWWPPLASRGIALARDLAGTGLDAAPQGDAALSLDGEHGWAWALDGSGDYLTPGDPATGALDFGSGSFSICVWVKASVLSGDLFRSILSKRTSSNYVGWSLFVWRSGHPTLANRVGFEAASSHAGPYYDATADAALPLDTWVHVIGVVDRAANETRLYINGVKQATAANATGLGSVDNSTPVEIGREVGISTWNGRIADVRIYRVAVDDRLAWQLWAPEARWDLYRLLPAPVIPPAPAVVLQLSGSAAGLGSASASLQVSRRLTGSALGLALVSAAPLVSRRLAAASAGSGSTTGAPLLARSLAGSSAGVGLAAGDCRLSRLCQGASAGSAAATGAPTLSRLLAGSSTGSGASSAAPALSRLLNGTAPGLTTASAAMEIRRLLTGISAGVGATTGAFYRPSIELVGICSGVGSAAAALQISRPLAGRSAGAGVVTGSVLIRRLLTGRAAGIGRSVGTLTLTIATGPVRYSGLVAIMTVYGGSAELAVDYAGDAAIWHTYSGTLEHG